MKTDYKVEWLDNAQEKLLKQAEWIKQNSKNQIIALKFYESVKEQVNKLSFTADAYKLKKDKKIPILNGNYIAHFIMDDQCVYISDFYSAKQNKNKP